MYGVKIFYGFQMPRLRRGRNTNLHELSWEIKKILTDLL